MEKKEIQISSIGNISSARKKYYYVFILVALVVVAGAFSLLHKKLESISYTVPSKAPDTGGKSAMAILDTYPSLAGVKKNLLEIGITDNRDASHTNGYDVLKALLLEQNYNPQDENESKENLLNAFFINYQFSRPGTKLFIVNTAGGLWTEAHHTVPWSLRDLSLNDIESLFIQNDSIDDYTTFVMEGRPKIPDLPNTELQINLYGSYNKIAEDSHFKQYDLAFKLAKDAQSPREAAENIAMWAEKNFFHAVDEPGNSWPWSVYLDGREANRTNAPWDNAYPLSIERIYGERVVGCQEPTIFLEGILHNLNIPAVRLSVWGHGVLYLPSLDVYIHGDMIAMFKFPKGYSLTTKDQMLPIAQNKNEFLAPLTDAFGKNNPLSLNMKRSDKNLYISNGPFYVYPQKTCIIISPDQWRYLTKDFSEFELYYDQADCRVKSKTMQPIQTLNELNN